MYTCNAHLGKVLGVLAFLSNEMFEFYYIPFGILGAPVFDTLVLR